MGLLPNRISPSSMISSHLVGTTWNNHFCYFCCKSSISGHPCHHFFSAVQRTGKKPFCFRPEAGWAHLRLDPQWSWTLGFLLDLVISWITFEKSRIQETYHWIIAQLLSQLLSFLFIFLLCWLIFLLVWLHAELFFVRCFMRYHKEQAPMRTRRWPQEARQMADPLEINVSEHGGFLVLTWQIYDLFIENEVWKHQIWGYLIFK